MIVSLSGTLVEQGADHAVVEVHGVGYQVHMGARQLAQLPAMGASVRIATHLVHREDAMLLYGFSSPAERELFLQLNSVSGVGAKTALSILSSQTPEQIVWAIVQKAPQRLAQAPGVGKKTAERIILELREKLSAQREAFAEVSSQAVGEDEAELALISLGYDLQEARAALQGLPAGLDSEAAIREAIARLS